MREGGKSERPPHLKLAANIHLLRALLEAVEVAVLSLAAPTGSRSRSGSGSGAGYGPAPKSGSGSGSKGVLAGAADAGALSMPGGHDADTVPAGSRHPQAPVETREDKHPAGWLSSSWEDPEPPLLEQLLLMLAVQGNWPGLLWVLKVGMHLDPSAGGPRPTWPGGAPWGAQGRRVWIKWMDEHGGG